MMRVMSELADKKVRLLRLVLYLLSIDRKTSDRGLQVACCAHYKAIY